MLDEQKLVFLNEIRNRLFDINKKVREMESNMIFLLVNPDAVIIEEINKQQDLSSLDAENNSNTITRPKTDFGQEKNYLTDPSQVHAKLAEYMSMRYELLIEEKEILGAIDTERKLHPHSDFAKNIHGL